MQDRPTTVPAEATQVGKNLTEQERRSRWPWVEASIWTDRMLAALETGVKGGCWFSLMDKVYSLKNLWTAWAKSAKNNGAPGVDGITIDRFEKDAETNLEYLSEQLKADIYQPKER
jgi:RNA-directed DNA polymerase